MKLSLVLGFAAGVAIIAYFVANQRSDNPNFVASVSFGIAVFVGGLISAIVAPNKKTPL